MKNLKRFESFNLTGNEFLTEDYWKDMVPKKLTVKRNGKTGYYKVRDKVKNMNSIIIHYYLDQSDSDTLSNNITIDISFKENNQRIDIPLKTEFECTIEITMGALYILGVKIFDDNKTMDFIERKAEINDSALNKISELVKYVTNFKPNLK